MISLHQTTALTAWWLILAGFVVYSLLGVD
jgi:hypothetical protein